MLNYLNWLNYRRDRGADGLVKVASVQFYFSFLFSAGCCDELVRLSGRRGPDKVTCAPHPILFWVLSVCSLDTRLHFDVATQTGVAFHSGSVASGSRRAIESAPK